MRALYAISKDYAISISIFQHCIDKEKLLSSKSKRVSRGGETMLNETRMTHEELAKALRVQPCTVRFWTRLGCPYEPAGRLRFYNLENVKRWLREQDEKKRAERAKQKEAA
jgi:hypothetical protein